MGRAAYHQRSTTTVRNRRIKLETPDELPDGTKILVTAVAPQRIGIDKSEWRDDTAALADWEVWIKAIEPIQVNAVEAPPTSPPNNAGKKAEPEEANNA